MDPAPLAVRVGHRGGHLSDALPDVLSTASAFWRTGILIAVGAALVSATLVAQEPDRDLLARLDTLRSIPVPGPLVIQPRVFSAYGALIAAAMLSLLYLYRGRPFIVYWITSWLLVAAALGLVARGYSDPIVGSLLTGVAMLCAVCASGLVLLAAHAVPDAAVQWGRPVKWGLLAAGWFLVVPFAGPLVLLIGSGTVAAAGLLGWAASRYWNIGRRSGYAGAFLIAAALSVIAGGNLLGAVLAIAVPAAGVLLNQLAAVNVVTSMFVALGMHLLVFEDMTEELRLTNRELAAANEEVKRLAITDPLTGCHNRRFFDEIERREMQRHRRYGTPMSVVFVDVNQFKRLNDTLGHDRGDDVLRTIGLLLRRQVRESDYVIRWGGDEFLLLLTCSEIEAQSKANELKIAFDRERVGSGLPDYVGLSIGVAPVLKGADTLREAIRGADSRMYRDKLSERTAVGRI